MRAQPDDHVPTGTGLLTRPALAGALIWMLFVGALTVTYAVAYGRSDASSQFAAVWALSIAVALAVVAVPSVLRRTSGASVAVSWPERATMPVYLLLLVGSVALIGISVSLTLDGRPAGAWALLLPAAAGPLLVLSERWLITAGVPAVEDTDAAGDSAATTRTDIPSTDDAEEAQPVEETPQEARELMRPDYLELLRERQLAIAVEEDCWEAARHRLDPEADEQGGVALTVQAEDTLLVLGMVFPAQTRASAVRCEFSTDEVDRVRRGVNSVATGMGLPPGTVKMAWVHTHPRMGVFLSGTDLATSARWRSLDPAFRPIVVDVSKAQLENQIGVFGADGHKILPIGTVGGLIEPGPARRMSEAIERIYTAERRPVPLVLMGRSPHLAAQPVQKPAPIEAAEPEGTTEATTETMEGRHATDG